jgi:hypothetical protein
MKKTKLFPILFLLGISLGTLTHAMEEQYFGPSKEQAMMLYSQSYDKQEEEKSKLRELAKQRAKTLKALNNNPTCLICREESQHDRSKGWTCVQNCNHPFHVDCILQWALYAAENAGKKCPWPGCNQPYNLVLFPDAMNTLDEDKKISLMQNDILPMDETIKDVIFWKKINALSEDIKNRIVKECKIPNLVHRLFQVYAILHLIKKLQQTCTKNFNNFGSYFIDWCKENAYDPKIAMLHTDCIKDCILKYVMNHYPKMLLRKLLKVTLRENILPNLLLQTLSYWNIPMFPLKTRLYNFFIITTTYFSLSTLFLAIKMGNDIYNNNYSDHQNCIGFTTIFHDYVNNYI